MSQTHTEDRVATLHALLNESAVRIGEQRLVIKELRNGLKKIAGESPSREPCDEPTVGPHPNWTYELQASVADIIREAFAEGYSRACWELGQIADAALKATGEA